MSGNASPLWSSKGGEGGWGIPSPDGQHVAFVGSLLSANIWTLENF